MHPQASLIGRWRSEPDCYIAPFASLRGDFGAIRVGAGANVQDSCTVHGAHDGEVVLEDDAHLGHGCIVHNAWVGRDVLVGMNAVVLDGVCLGDGSVVGSGCVVPAGLVVPAGKLDRGRAGEDTSATSSRSWPLFKRVGTRWYQHLAGRTRDRLPRCRSSSAAPRSWADRATDGSRTSSTRSPGDGMAGAAVAGAASRKAWRESRHERQ